MLGRGRGEDPAHESPGLRQLTLFETEPRPLGREGGGPGESEARSLADSSEPGPDQIDLFSERARLARDVDDALREGDFSQALRLRCLFEENHGVSEETRALRLLEGFDEALASPVPEEALGAFHNLDPSFDEHPRLRRLLRTGVFGRLLRSHSPDDLASASPASIPILAWFLAAGPAASPEEGMRQARRLVRDALVAGRRLESLDFRWDEALTDLLAEDDSPPWLACLGVIRRVWPATRPGPEPLGAVPAPMAGSASEEVAALAFWSCLRAAENRDATESTLYEARRRMKALRPAFHALYMRRIHASRTVV